MTPTGSTHRRATLRIFSHSADAKPNKPSSSERDARSQLWTVRIESRHSIYAQQ